MTTKIPETHIDLLTTKKAFANLATTMSDGTPQVTPVWIDFDGTHVLFNSAKGRVKDKNLETRRDVALAISDPENPYRYLGIRGKIVEITEVGGDAHIDKLAKKYMDKDSYPYRNPAEVRRIYKIEPTSVHVMGLSVPARLRRASRQGARVARDSRQLPGSEKSHEGGKARRL